MNTILIPAILCGGAGTRLWPVSRELHPKPFIQLTDGQSLLQKAFLRAAALPGVAEVLTVTNRNLYFKTIDEYQAVSAQHLLTSFILEPFSRNTAPAITMAALQTAQVYGEDALLLVLPADHLINNQVNFHAAVAEAVILAKQNYLVTFGMKPNRAETGYGYIEAAGHTVKRFIEKPSLIKAQAYYSSGNYLWNGGMFCFRAGKLLEELKLHAADISLLAQNCFAASIKVKGKSVVQVALDAAIFQEMPNISIDYALMEKTQNAAVVACDIGWSDIGSWEALSNLEMPDSEGNRVIGDVLLHGTKNCYIQSKDRLVALVGVEDLIIIDTPDALLVSDKTHVQEVKEIVGQLKNRGHDAYKIHREVHRPWGSYTVLEDGNHFKIKRIVVKPRATLSLQMHHHRSEHWIVVSGIAKVINGVQELLVNTNESTFIPAGHKHRLENPGILDLVMIEVQSGEYLGEDDIIRFEDCYGRAP